MSGRFLWLAIEGQTLSLIARPRRLLPDVGSGKRSIPAAERALL
jgi:hypothetical protein